MKKSYRWLFIFMIMAALSACTDHEDHLYGASGAGGEEVNPEATTEDALVLKSVTKYSTFHEEDENGAMVYLREQVATCDFTWEFGEDEIVTTGEVSSENPNLARDQLTVFLNEKVLKPEGLQLSLGDSPFASGKLRTNYQGQILACELDLSKIEFRPNTDSEFESAGTLLLEFAHDAGGQISEIAISKDGDLIGTLSLANTYADGKLRSQVAEYQPSGSDADPATVYMAKFDYPDGKLTLTTITNGQERRVATIGCTYAADGSLATKTTTYFSTENPDIPEIQLINTYAAANGKLSQVTKLVHHVVDNEDVLEEVEQQYFEYGANGKLTVLTVQPIGSPADVYEFEWVAQAVPTKALAVLNGSLMSDFGWVFTFCGATYTSTAGNGLLGDFLQAVYRPVAIAAD